MKRHIMNFDRSLSTAKIFFLISLFAFSNVLAQQLPSSYIYAPPEKLKDSMQTGTLKGARMDEAKIVAGTNEILKGTYPNIHSLLIFRDGKLVFEEYFTGEDVERGVGPVGVVKHNRDTLHDMRSVTKSIVAVAVLIAHSQGKIKSLDQPIFDFFPEFSRYADADKKNITVKHVLTMTAGLEWNEGISYADPKNSEIQMNKSADPIGYALSQKLVAEPGTVFNYSGGMTQVLAAIIKKSTGMDVDMFTEKHLFAPLRITKYKWVKTNSGDPSAASGLRLRSLDMAKIGMMMLNMGKWNGRRIIPKRLAEEALKAHIRVPVNNPGGDVDYGFQIWLPNYKSNGVSISVAEFEGNGGQFVVIDRKNNILVAITAGNYNQRELKKGSYDIYPDIIFPAIYERR